MLNKKYRFHSRGGVRYVYQHGKTVRSSKMSLVFVKNARGFTRIVVVVSKKVMKAAVGRNRIRRRVYEAIRMNFDKIPHGIDYVFVVYSKDVGRMAFGELEKMISGLISEAEICYNKKNG